MFSKSGRLSGSSAQQACRSIGAHVCTGLTRCQQFCIVVQASAAHNLPMQACTVTVLSQQSMRHENSRRLHIHEYTNTHEQTETVLTYIHTHTHTDRDTHTYGQTYTLHKQRHQMGSFDSTVPSRCIRTLEEEQGPSGLHTCMSSMYSCIPGQDPPGRLPTNGMSGLACC